MFGWHEKQGKIYIYRKESVNKRENCVFLHMYKNVKLKIGKCQKKMFRIWFAIEKYQGKYIYNNVWMTWKTRKKI